MRATPAAANLMPRRALRWFALLALGAGPMAAFSSCARAHEDTRFLRDGVQYGVTEGAFRGRWWNHYERGGSFLQGGFWEEAEADFRRALAGRAIDQRWARTYGLHFTPEYFPNRELGIAHYYQGQHGDAVSRLEVSLSQHYSARAAYYLTRARRAIVMAEDLDRTRPSFDIAPRHGQWAAADLETTLEGTARDDTYITGIWIDGQPYPLDVSAPAVVIHHPVTLRPGANVFTLKLEDIAGNRTVKEVELRVDSDGPTVSFDPVSAAATAITGVVYDPSGVTRFTVGNAHVPLHPRDDGSMAFAIPKTLLASEGRRFQSEDTLGNITSGDLPIPPRPAVASIERVRFAQLGTGLVVPERVAIFASVAEPTVAPRARILDPREGRIFRSDEIAVTYELASAVPLQAAAMNGVALPIVPGREQQRGTRRLLLDGPGPHTIVLEAHDRDGNRTIEEVQVERQENELERVAMLDAAFVGITDQRGFERAAESEAYGDAVTSWIFREFHESGRFAGLRDRDPAALSAVITERELSAALASKDGALALYQLVPAELIILGRMRQWPDSIELILEGKSTEVAGNEEVITLAYADVAGSPEGRADLEEMVRVLVVRFLQQIPRARGQIAVATNQRVTSTLGEQPHGIKRHQKAVVFALGEPITDPSNPAVVLEEAEILILGEALITAVRDATSDLQVVRRTPEFADMTIERGHFIVTK